MPINILIYIVIALGVIILVKRLFSIIFAYVNRKRLGSVLYKIKRRTIGGLLVSIGLKLLNPLVVTHLVYFNYSSQTRLSRESVNYLDRQGEMFNFNLFKIFILLVWIVNLIMIIGDLIKPKIYEKGISTFDSVFRWEELDGYYEKYDVIFIIKKKKIKWIPTLNDIDIHVIDEQRSEVYELLSRYIKEKLKI